MIHLVSDELEQAEQEAGDMASAMAISPQCLRAELVFSDSEFGVIVRRPLTLVTDDELQAMAAEFRRALELAMAEPVAQLEAATAGLPGVR